MKGVPFIALISAFVLTSLFLVFITSKPPGNMEDIFLMFGREEVDISIKQVYTDINFFELYPKDLKETKRLLGELIGENNTLNGNLAYPSIYIKRYERLGNNILQLSNAIFFSEIMGVSTIYIERGFCWINNPITTSTGIKIIPTDEIPKDSFVMHRNIFLIYSGHYCPENRAYEFANETLKSVPHVEINDNGLYIHIRSGDIFSANPCSFYGQPPVCFYESIIEKWNFRDIYIITEDRKSPVTNYLVEKYNAKLIITDLPQTIGYILNSKNLVLSYGTFLPSLLKLVPEDPEKRIFRYGNTFGYNLDIWKKFYFTDISKYYREQLLNNNWNNTEEQKQIMMNETCGDEWKVSIYTKFKDN